MGFGSILGALLGGLLVGILPASVLKVLLGLVLIAASLKGISSRKKENGMHTSS